MALAIPVQGNQVPPPAQVQVTSQMDQEMLDAGRRRIGNLGTSFTSCVVGTELVFMSLEATSKTNELSYLFFAALGALQGGHGAYKFAKNWPIRVTHQLIREEQCTACIQLLFIAISMGLSFGLGSKI
jgi:hypothetical protein